MTGPAATVVRTVLGDIPKEDLGITLPHEHLIIARGKPVEVAPDIRHDSVDEATAELCAAAAVGVRSVVDAMPCDAGRDIEALASISTATGMHVIAATGIHHPRYYEHLHWSRRLDEDTLAQLFIGDIEVGIDRWDYSAPTVERTMHRAGILKVAGEGAAPSNDTKRILRAAASAQRATGVLILVHCEHGTGALEIIGFLVARGVQPEAIAVAHVDKVVDRGYHGEIAATGAYLAYDRPHCWSIDGPNHTAELLESMIADGWGSRLLVSMDAARRSLWATLGGSPGLAFVHGAFARQLERRGIPEADRRRLFIENPAEALRLRR